MSTDMIRFDVLVQEALRGVVRKVLGEVARAGLPGEHHFYVTFDTTHPGVRVSARVKARYPEEMTIVLQHQFWDLNVTEAGFDVGLSFGGIPEKLVIPFAAVKGFFDPSVQFGLQFEVAREEGEERPAGALAEGPRPVPVAVAPSRLEASRPETGRAETGRSETGRAETGRPETAQIDPPDDVVVVANPDESAPEAAPQPSATVVSLDQFRKKT